MPKDNESLKSPFVIHQGDNANFQTASTTYAQAGVDIASGNQLIELIKPFAKQTSRIGADAELGGFGGLFDLSALSYKNPVLIASTDGVGTKLKLANHLNKHDTIGIDLVAMCVNDIIVQGGEPLFFLDYFATSGLDISIASQVIKGIAAGCKIANCALIGGETAEMPGMYQRKDYDIAGFAVGIAEKDRLLPQNITVGDEIIAVASSGVHANGFSLIHYILRHNEISFDDPAPFLPGYSIGEALLHPTNIYIKPCLEILPYCHGFAHITGGGLTENIPRILPHYNLAEIKLSSWQLPELFTWIKKLGKIDLGEMLRVFNCGIGMVIIAPPENRQKIIANFASHNFGAWKIGDITVSTEKLPRVVYI